MSPVSEKRQSSAQRLENRFDKGRVHFVRAPMPDSITNAIPATQVDQLAGTTTPLLPDESLVIGEERLFAELNKSAPKTKATSLILNFIKGYGQVLNAH